MNNEIRERKPIVRDFRKSLRLLERQIERNLSSQTDCCGVTVAQCHLILELDLSESEGRSGGKGGGIGIGECARALDLDASTLSRTVESLVKAGLASRETDTNNRRRQIVALTGSGRARAADIHRLCDSYYGRILASLPEAERRIVVDGIAVLAAALRAQPFTICPALCEPDPQDEPYTEPCAGPYAEPCAEPRIAQSV